MKNDILLKIFSFVLALCFTQSLQAKDKIFFSSIPKSIEIGTEFNITCKFLDTEPAGDTIKTWDWYFIGWNVDRLDTLAAFHSDLRADSCIWNGSIGTTGFASITGKFPDRAFLVVHAVNAENISFYITQRVSLRMPSNNCGCLYDMLYTYPITFMLTPHQEFACQSRFYDDDYNGSFADYWFWRIALLSAEGFEIIAGADSVYAHNEFTFSTSLGSIDLNKNWIYSDSGTISGILAVYVTSSDGTRFYTSHDFQFGNQPTGVRSSETTPASLQLHQNYPNPFNPATTIEYEISTSAFSERDKQGFVSLKVYDLLGRVVATLVNEQKPAGKYVQHWNASALPSGAYLYCLQAGLFSESKRLILLK